MRIIRGQPRQERVITSGGESFFARRFKPEYFGYGWHTHPELELTLIVKGRGTRAVGDSIELYRAGDLVLLGSHTLHSWKSEPADGSVESIVIQFAPVFVESMKLPEFKSIAKVCESGKRGLFVPPGSTQRLVANRMTELLDAPPGSARRVMLLLESLVTLAEADDLRPLSATVMTTSKNEKKDSILQRVLQMIQAGEELSQAEIAEQFDMSPQAFSRFFTTQLGKTFVMYVNEWRIGNACRLLAETKEDVTSIAFKSGYNNLSNFNRRFLKIKGMTPRAYRAQVAQHEATD